MNFYEEEDALTGNFYEQKEEERTQSTVLSDPFSNNTRRNAAITEADNSDDDLLGAVSRNLLSDPDATIESAVTARANAQIQGIDSHVEYTINNPSVEGLAGLSEAGAAKELIRTENTAESWTDVAAEDAAELEGRTDAELVIAQAAADDALLEAVRKAAKDRSILNTLGDIGEGILPFMASTDVDLRDLVKSVTGQELGYFDDKEGLMLLRGIWRSWSPEQKQKYTEPLVRAAIESADFNESVAEQLINFMVLPEERISAGLVAVDKIFDIGTVFEAPKIISSIFKVAKRNNGINRLATLGRKDEAVEAVVRASEDTTGETAKFLGLTPEEVAAIESPMDHADFYAGLTDGLSDDVRRFQKAVQQTNEAFSQSVNMSRAELARNRFEAAKANPEFSNVKLDQKTGEVTFTRKLEGADDEVVSIPVNIADDFNVFATKELGLARGNVVINPATKLVDDFLTVVQLPTVGQQLAARSKISAQKLLKEFNSDLKSLPKTEQDLINRIVKEGDASSKVFNLNELREKGLVGERAQAAYYKVRVLNDNAYTLESNRLHQAYKSEGFDQLYNTSDITSAAAKVVQNPDATLRSAKVRSIWNAADEAPMPADSLKPRDLEENVVIRFRGPSQLKDQNYYDYALVPRAELRNLRPTDILPKRDGYVTNIHSNARYFVRKPIKATVNGIASDIAKKSTVRAFSTRKKADEWIKTAKNEDGSKMFPNDSLPDGWDVKFDGDFDFISKKESLGNYSGLFTGHRKENGLIVDGHINQDLANPFEATAEYYQHLANKGVLGSYRSELKQRWLNTYKSRLPVEFQGNFADAMRGLEEGGIQKGSKEWRAAKELHDQVRASVGMRTVDEMASERVVRAIAETSDIGSRIYFNLASKGGLSGIAKAAVFQLNLGLLNFSQILVQGSGMIATFGAHPIAFSKMLPKNLASSLADMHLAPLPKGRVHDLWRASQLSKTTNMAADVGASLGKADILKVFFAQGENLNRRAAFYTMYDVLKSRKGRELTQDDLGELIGESHRITLNFTNVNESKFQKGWSGVVFQFQQVIEKSLNQIYNPLLRSPLTTRERLGMASAQGLFFGLSGVPFMEAAFNRWNSVFADQGMDEETASLVTEGLVGAIPVKNDFASRLSFGDVHGNFYSQLVAGQLTLRRSMLENMRKGMLGPFGSNMARAIEGSIPIKDAYKAGNLPLMLHNTKEMLLNMPSSMRNFWIVDQYRRTGVLSSGRGKPLTKEEFSMVEQAFIGMGFPPQLIEDSFEAMDMIQAQENFVKDMVDFAIEAWKDGVDLEHPLEWHAGGTMANIMAGSSEEVQQEVHRRFKKKYLKDEKTLVEKVGDKGVKAYFEASTNPLINPGELKNGQLR